jgi:hypothetical protein
MLDIELQPTENTDYRTRRLEKLIENRTKNLVANTYGEHTAVRNRHIKELSSLSIELGQRLTENKYDKITRERGNGTEEREISSNWDANKVYPEGSIRD